MYIPCATVPSISPLLTLSRTVTSTSNARTLISFLDSATAVGPAVPATPSTQNTPTMSSFACNAAARLSVPTVVSPALLTLIKEIPGAFSLHQSSKP